MLTVMALLFFQNAGLITAQPIIVNSVAAVAILETSHDEGED